jgi:hypothetical protein
VVMTRERWMALFFAGGSTCFLGAPFPGYASLVGGRADSVTFFVGSILLTAGGAVQTSLALSERHSSDRGPAAWQAAAIQSAGTLCFNVTCRAVHAALHNSTYHKLVWRRIRSDRSGFSSRARSPTAPRPGVAGYPCNRSGWWEPGINLLGCVFFGNLARRRLGSSLH